MREMKDSGIEWVGEIPFKWSLNRIQYCLSEINVKNYPIQTDRILSLVKDKGVMLYEEKGDIGNKSKDNISEYKLAYPQTLVVNSMNILIGSVGISNYFGCVSPVYYVFKETDQSDLRYINYIFNTREFQRELHKYANGILEIRLRVSAQDIFKRLIPFPPKMEQNAIANYLDAKCVEIDALIADIQSQIDTLEQYKRSVITEAVTKGLDRNVEMKESGIEYIGSVSKFHQVCRVKDVLTKITDGAHITPDTSCDDEPFVSVTDMNEFGIIDSDNCLRITEEQYKYFLRTGCKPQKGDVLISKDGTIGKTTVMVSDPDYVVASSIVIMRPNQKLVLPKFLEYSLNCTYVQQQLEALLAGSALRRVSVVKNSNLKIVITNIAEQRSIVSFLDRKCSGINSAILEKKQQLDILDAYKKSTIYEYVTGKKEVPA